MKIAEVIIDNEPEALKIFFKEHTMTRKPFVVINGIEAICFVFPYNWYAPLKGGLKTAKGGWSCMPKAVIDLIRSGSWDVDEK